MTSWTLIFPPNVPFLLEQIFEKNKINLHAILIPVAIINGIKKFLSIKVSIKWPNDIMYNNKKLGF